MLQKKRLGSDVLQNLLGYELQVLVWNARLAHRAKPHGAVREMPGHRINIVHVGLTLALGNLEGFGETLPEILDEPVHDLRDFRVVRGKLDRGVDQ